MHRTLIGLTLLGGLSSTAWALDVGDPAPRFALHGSDGESHRLEDHLGKQVIVLAWFPKAFTGG
jgi:peroxiredoxin Q/BCP